MDPSGLALSIFSVWTQICAFALKLKTAELEHKLQSLKLQDCAQEIGAAIKNIQSVPVIDDNDILSLIELIDLTIDWLSHFATADVAQPLNEKQATILKLDSQLLNKFRDLQSAFAVVNRKVVKVQLGSTAAQVTRPKLEKYLLPARKGVKQVKTWVTRGRSASAWVLFDGPKMVTVIEGLGVLKKRWSDLAAKILPKKDTVRPALSLAPIANRPIASSQIVSSLLLSGSKNTPEEKYVAMGLIRDPIRSLLQRGAVSALWFHGPACSGKSTLAANLALQLEEFVKEDTPKAQPVPVVTMSHVQFVGDSSESVILHDIMCQLKNHQKSPDSSTDKHASIFSPLDPYTTNKDAALASLRDYLSRSPLIMILDGVEATSSLWKSVVGLLKSYSNLMVICFSRDSNGEVGTTNKIEHHAILPSISLLESQVSAVVKKNPAVGPYLKSLLKILSRSFGAHFGLTSLLLTRLSVMGSENIEGLLVSLTPEKFELISQRMDFMQTQERATAVFCVVYLVALLGQTGKEFVTQLGHVIHKFMPVLFPDKRNTVSATDTGLLYPPNSPHRQPFKDNFAGVFEVSGLDDLLLIDEITVSLKDPNQAEEILHIISSRAPYLCNRVVGVICDQHHADPDAVRLLREITKAFPESRFELERYIKSGIEGAGYLVAELEKAGAALSDRYGVFERVDMRRGK